MLSKFFEDTESDVDSMLDVDQGNLSSNPC